MARVRIVMLIVAMFLCAAGGVAHGGLDYFGSHDDGTKVYMRNVEYAHLEKSGSSNNNIYDLIRMGEVRYAIVECRYVLDRIPNHPRALQIIGSLAQMTKNTALGLEYYEKAVKEFPQYALTRAQFGLFMVTIGNVDDGVRMLEKSVEMDPKLQAGYAGLAHAYAKKGETNKARESAQKARELGFKGQLPTGF